MPGCKSARPYTPEESLLRGKAAEMAAEYASGIVSWRHDNRGWLRIFFARTEENFRRLIRED